MKVAYIREGKKWIRAAWVCPRCFSVENTLHGDFKNDKRVHYKNSNPYVNPQEAYQKADEAAVKAT
jgi:hypothetical protein